MSVIPTRYSDGPGSVVSHDRSAGPESVASKSWTPIILHLVLWAMSRNYAKTFLHFSHAIFLKKNFFKRKFDSMDEKRLLHPAHARAVRDGIMMIWARMFWGKLRYEDCAAIGYAEIILVFCREFSKMVLFENEDPWVIQLIWFGL